jgi:hypothetical protein
MLEREREEDVQESLTKVSSWRILVVVGMIPDTTDAQRDRHPREEKRER